MDEAWSREGGCVPSSAARSPSIAESGAWRSLPPPSSGEPSSAVPALAQLTAALHNPEDRDVIGVLARDVVSRGKGGDQLRSGGVGLDDPDGERVWNRNRRRDGWEELDEEGDREVA